MRLSFLLVTATMCLACSGADEGAPGSGVVATEDASIDGASPPKGDAGSHDASTIDSTVPDSGHDSGPCDETMALVTVDAGHVCIDLFEGALVAIESDGGESMWPYYENVDARDAGTYRAIPADGVKPQGYISQEQATAACVASGKRLCTFDEWTAACRGQPTHDYVYPYGDTYEAGACNEGKESPIVVLFGPNPTYDNTELNDPRCDQLDGGLAYGGSYPKCVSTYGAFDMHGNIHEWIDDTPSLDHGSFMGGYFVDAKINGPGCEYRTTAHAKTYHDYSTGFRCCADPK